MRAYWFPTEEGPAPSPDPFTEDPDGYDLDGTRPGRGERHHQGGRRS